jgi:ubiquinone biosynthesis protein UbiJ
MLLLETVINRYLALDPEVLEKMAVFSGNVIKIEVTGVDKVFYLFPDDKGVHVSTEHEGHVDTVLRGTAISLFKMGLTADVASLLLKNEVEITGDTRMGHQFKNVLSQMDIDWTGVLANLLGDSLAYQLHQSGKKFGQWGKHTVESVSLSFSEYLQEESRDVVTETELEIFNDAVDQLRDDVDRLQAKMKSLSK